MKTPNKITFPEELYTVKDWVRWCSSLFNKRQLYFGHGTDNAWDEAVTLVLWALNQPWERLELISDARLDKQEKELIFNSAVTRAVDKTPLPYITQEAWFAGLKFKVTEDVLIPRSPIAEIIANQFSPFLSYEPHKILDLCTGSGCIGIVCALHYEQAEVDLADISSKALQVANENIQQFQLEDRVKTIESDLFTQLTDRYDIIVTNPPYVDAYDMSTLPDEYHAEPRLALESGDDGLDITRTILKQASRFLNDNGLLVCEVGNSWIALQDSMPEVPFFWPELEQGGHGVFILTKEQCNNLST